MSTDIRGYEALLHYRERFLLRELKQNIAGDIGDGRILSIYVSRAGIAQQLECQTRGQKVLGLSPRRSGEGFLLRGQLSVLTYFGICSTSVLSQSHGKDSCHSAKSAGGRLQPSIHAPYLCGFE